MSEFVGFTSAARVSFLRKSASSSFGWLKPIGSVAKNENRSR